jgi:MFS transporter, DHA1 family, inner membrane transport protein
VGLPTGLRRMLVAKTLANMALRLPYVFLPQIAKGVHASIGSLGAKLGIGELLGLLTILIGRSLDRGQYKRWTTIGGISTSIGALTMWFATSSVTFGFGFSLVAVGVAWFTTTAHAWLGATTSYESRGKAIGTYELSWALSVLVGAPIVGLLLTTFHWNTPFIVIAVLCALTTVIAVRSLSAGTGAASPQNYLTKRATLSWRLPKSVVLTMASSVLLTFAAVSVFSLYGSWLQDRFKLNAATVGVFSVAIGGAELVASSVAATLMDRWGKIRSVSGGILVMIVGVGAVIVTPKVTAIAIAALVIVFLGFEFGFVSLLTIISEVGDEQRGTVVAIDHALSPLSRAGAAALATGLYQHGGMQNPSLIALTLAAASLVALRLSNAHKRER